MIKVFGPGAPCPVCGRPRLMLMNDYGATGDVCFGCPQRRVVEETVFGTVLPEEARTRRPVRAALQLPDAVELPEPAIMVAVLELELELEPVAPPPRPARKRGFPYRRRASKATGKRTYRPRTCTGCGKAYQPTGPRGTLCLACNPVHYGRSSGAA